MKHDPELRDAVARALAGARAIGRSATVYDLFGSLLQVSQIDRMVRETGGDTEALAAGLQAAAGEKPRQSFAPLFWFDREDVLFLMLTSHGSDEPSLSVSNETWPLDQLDADTPRSALEASLIKWRIVVISACYLGAFVESLADRRSRSRGARARRPGAKPAWHALKSSRGEFGPV